MQKRQNNFFFFFFDLTTYSLIEKHLTISVKFKIRISQLIAN